MIKKDIYQQTSDELDRMKHAKLNESEIVDILLEMQKITNKISFKEERVDYQSAIDSLLIKDYSNFTSKLKGIKEHLRWLLDVKKDNAITEIDNQIYNILTKKEEVMVRLLNYFEQNYQGRV